MRSGDADASPDFFIVTHQPCIESAPTISHRPRIGFVGNAFMHSANGTDQSVPYTRGWIGVVGANCVRPRTGEDTCPYNFPPTLHRIRPYNLSPTLDRIRRDGFPVPRTGEGTYPYIAYVGQLLTPNSSHSPILYPDFSQNTTSCVYKKY